MIETDRLVAADPSDGREEAVDRAIRPRRLDDYIGQTAVREQMEIFSFCRAGARRAAGPYADFSDHPGWVRRLWPALLLRRWAFS